MANQPTRRRARRRHLQAATAGAALLALTACGSTVHSTGSSLTSGGDALGGPAASAAGSGLAPGTAAPTTTAGGPAALTAGAAPALGKTTTSVSGTGPAGTSAPAGRTYRDSTGVVQGIGVTATTISIGMGYTTNGDAANAALGADKITQGDIKGETQAIIDDINAHGGMAGRKLVPVWHGWDAQSAQTRAQQDQAACADYTQDHKVFAVLDLGGDDFQACLKKAGKLQLFAGDIISSDAQYFREFPHFMDLGTMSQDRMMADEVKSFIRQGWFGGWDTTAGAPAPAAKAKLGILSINDPSWNRPLEKILLPALARAGHPVDANDVYRVNPGNSSADTGATIADIQSSALRFRNDGVTHVIFLDSTGALTLFFAQNAKNQRYFPRFGASSASGMQALYDAGVMDPAQLKGAMGIGWLPGLDLPVGAGDKYGTPATKHCLDVLKKRGFTFTSTNAASIALSGCDNLYFLRDAINAAGASITLSTVQAAVDAMGARFVPAEVPAMFFSATRHDGAELAFDMKWDDACTCAKYVDNGHHA